MKRYIYKLKPIDIGRSTLSIALVDLGLGLKSKELIRRGCIISDYIFNKYCPKLYGFGELKFTKIITYK